MGNKKPGKKAPVHSVSVTKDRAPKRSALGRSALGPTAAKPDITKPGISAVSGFDSRASHSNELHLVGVRENNLKNISLNIPHDRFIAITGLSGSGKTTFAYDTIYAEGGRRYIETFSPYTRQFLDRLHQPKLDSISGVRPALALEQRNRATNSRSTVGTVTEINDYLKVVWTHLADTYCPDCDTLIPFSTPFVVRDALLRSGSGVQSQGDIASPGKTRPGTRKSRKEKSVPETSGSDGHSSEGHGAADALLVTFPIELKGDASFQSLVATLEQEGFVRWFDEANGEVLPLAEASPGTGQRLLVVVDRFRLPFSPEKTAEDRAQLLTSINQAYTFGHGELLAIFLNRSEKLFRSEVFREYPVCPSCGHLPPRRMPSLFTFNSPIGACAKCHGFGKVLEIDRNLIVPNPEKSIADGAVVPWATPSTKKEAKRLKQFCEEEGIDIHTPWSKLPAAQREKIFAGAKQKKQFPGIDRWFEWLGGKRHKMHVRIFLSRFRSEFLCPDCEGTRLRREALGFRVDGMRLPDIWLRPVLELVPVFEKLAEKYGEHPLAEIALEEIVSRLRYLDEIGLGYLTLDRQTRTLSGGENQRVNLTSLLGARLVNTMLVLDEPTIGLHAQDTGRLIRSIQTLRDRGNTVLVVEHDTEVIRTADEVIDIGPEAGNRGGEVIYQGPPQGLPDAPRSYTGRSLLPLPEVKRRKTLSVPKGKRLVVKGPYANNLRGKDVSIPLGCFAVLTGVSGSGKSSFVGRCLAAPFQRLKQGAAPEQLFRTELAPITGMDGIDEVRDLILIDQSPVGKTPRSNPATYTKAWDIIRDCLAETEAAQSLGLSRSAFSFNVDGGRCPVCKGAGHVRIEMQFLADVFVECEACGGYRFQDKVLSVSFAGKNVIELLDTSLEEVVELFRTLGEDHLAAKAAALLQPLLDLGLGYLRLGHPLSQMSGGEAQRLKLASYLEEKTESGYLFVLDEPTTGLHPHNVQQLLGAFDRLIERGHSVLCVEHNLEVILQADWLVDLGPGAGSDGGDVVAEGVPREIAADTALAARSKTVAALAEYVATGKEAEAAKKSAAKGGAPAPLFMPAAKKVVPHRPDALKEIRIEGAKHHNLKNVTVGVPQQTLAVITGVSGSGKSSLAFDILFAEGQRRYIDCLSPYARQYMKQLSRAAVDRVVNIPPTIAVSQKTSPPLGVTTVSTTTEIYQYLRLMYSKVGEQHCPHDNAKITSYSSESVTEEILAQFAGKRVFLFAPVVSGRKGYYNDLFQRAVRADLLEARVDGKMMKLHDELRLERHKLHWISLLIGSISSPEKNPQLLREAVEHALLLGGGTLEVAVGEKTAEPEIFSTQRVCPKCKRGYRALDPQDFSFRSARGICKKCQGRGKVPGGRSSDRELPCPDCKGARIGALGRHVYLDGHPIAELAALTPGALREFIQGFRYEERLAPVIEPIVREVEHRLGVIISVGLDYLNLDREANTLSGGEAQRLRLAKTLGSPLTGVCYILDEPSIGLHPQDQTQLMDTLRELRDSGNTVIVVEHDEELIRQAEHVIDIGPAGGNRGGELVYAGPVAGLEANERSLTGLALRERSTEALPPLPKPKDFAHGMLTIRGASANNLRGFDVDIPLQALTVVCGVSGAGKSSLVHSTLVPAVIAELLEKEPAARDKTWKELRGVKDIDRIIEIDQTPVGKTITSTPASFLGVFDEIRKFFASLPEAKVRGWGPGHFSFNSGKGRCEECQGRGFLKIPMSFLPEATSVCESCNGLRYNEGTKDVLFMGLSIGEVLQKTIGEAHEIFANHKRIRRALDVVVDLGLGYIALGQPTYTLSGGETQRLKIARELGAREAVNSVYILDEPTIGLHMTDVDKLMRVLRALVEKGNTVVIIEHNIDVLRAADYLIEIGPGPGENGGELLFQGAPAELAKSKKQTPTKPFLLPNGGDVTGAKIRAQSR